MIWGMVFGIGVAAALIYYIYRQVKDPGYKMFPNNFVKRDNLAEENS